MQVNKDNKKKKKNLQRLFHPIVFGFLSKSNSRYKFTVVEN